MKSKIRPVNREQVDGCQSQEGWEAGPKRIDFSFILFCYSEMWKLYPPSISICYKLSDTLLSLLL